MNKTIFIFITLLLIACSNPNHLACDNQQVRAGLPFSINQFLKENSNLNKYKNFETINELIIQHKNHSTALNSSICAGKLRARTTKFIDNFYIVYNFSTNKRGISINILKLDKRK